MAGRHESTSFRTTTIVLGFTVATILLFILMSSLFAPDRLEAPPISTITYEAPPTAEIPEFDFDSVPARSSDNPRIDSDATDNEQYSDDTYAKLTGTIVDEDTGEPVPNALVEVAWNYSEEEFSLIADLKEALRLKDLARQQKEQPEYTITDAELYTEEQSALLAEYKIEDDGDITRFNSKTGNRQRTYTDREGRFRIYLPFDRPVMLQASHVKYKSESFPNLEFEAGGDPEPMNIVLDPGASVSGRVYNVADNSGVAFIELSISALKLHGEPGESTRLYNHGSLETDKSGNYTLGGLIPGDYELRVHHQFTRFKPGKVLPYARITIATEEDDKTGVDFGLTRAGVVWGYVRNPETDEPLNASLLLVGPDNIITQGINAALSEYREQSRVFSTYTDVKKNGFYEIIGVDLNEEWRVYATTNDTAPQLSDPFILTETSPDIRVDMNMYAGTRVYGRVIDENGNGIPNADVYCIPGFADFFTPLNSAKTFQNGKSDKWGEFELGDLPNGNYQIFAMARGYKLTTRGTPILPDGYNDITGVQIRLHEIELGDHRIYGKVTDAAGRPVANATMKVAGFSIEAMLEREGDLSKETTTAEDGTYEFLGVSIGKYIMDVNHENFPEKRVTRVLLDKPTDVTMSSGAILAGKVYDGKTKRPYTGAFVITVGKAGGEAVRPDVSRPMESITTLIEHFDVRTETFHNENGEFEMVVQPGDYSIRAESGKNFSDSIEVQLEDGDLADNLKFFLGGGGGRIDGWVTTRDGSNPQGAKVTLAQMGQELIAGITMDDGYREETIVAQDGRFVFEEVPGGDYRVTATHPSHASAISDRIELGNGSNEETVTLVLGAGGSIEGYVTNRGRAVPNATVMLLGTIDSNAVSTDDNGFFYMDNVGAGNHQIIAIAAASINFANIDGNLGQPVTVNSGQTTRVSLELTRGAE